MDLQSAINGHAEWKIKFRNAITKKEQMDEKSVAKDNLCELGKWLYGEGFTKFGSLKSHAECLSKHAEFHKEVGKVAALINEGQYAQAESMIGIGSSYLQASNAVAGAIYNLKKEAGI
jgi:hypothetical protein